MLYLAGTVEPVARVPKKTRIVLACLLSVLFLAAFNNLGLRQWRMEQSSASTGRLYPKKDNIETLGKIDPSQSDVRLTIGPITGPRPTVFILNGNGKNWDPWGSKLSFNRINGVLTVDTDVHDRDGNLVAEIVSNDWRVFPNFVSEKNYSSNSLEVRDKRGKVVLKVALFDDYLQIEGEWWHEGGTGVRIVRPFPYDNEKPGPVFVEQIRPGYMSDEPSIAQMFKYPSDDHFGEMVDSKIKWWDRVFLLRALAKTLTQPPFGS